MASVGPWRHERTAPALPEEGGGGGSRSALPVEGREVATDRPLDWTGEAAGLT